VAGEKTGLNEIASVYPLSPTQQGMLFHSLLAQGSGVYIEQLLCDLFEMVDEAALRQAWLTVIRRHAVLRTSFRWADLDEPQQLVHAEVELPWEQQDWRGIADTEQERRLADHLEADRRRGFEMARAPVLRLTLIRRGDSKSRLIWTFHHALLDARSIPPILREVFSYYEAFRCGTELELELPRPFVDYIDWVQKQDFSEAEAFWRRSLEGFTEPTPLAIDRLPGKDRKSAIGGSERELRLSAENTSALRSLVEDNRLTLNTVVQGAWSLLLSRYSNEMEVVFGITRSCRRSTIEGAEAMVGLLINTLPMRVRVNPEAALIPWLKELRSQWVAMREHEHTSLERVQGWSSVPPGRALFESIVVFDNVELNSMLRAQGGPWSTRNFRLFQQTNYPVTLAVYGGAELVMKIGFDRRRLDEATVERMLGHMRTLLQAMAENPMSLLRDLPVLTLDERRELLVEWNNTAAEFPDGSCVHELFEAQVERTPDAIAVEFEGRHLTYRELNNRSNRLAHFLRKIGVGPEVLVGLCMHRSLEMIVSLFGVLKAGGAYVPIDPTYPPARLGFMLNDANAQVLLTQRKLVETLAPPQATRVICLDDPEWEIEPQDAGNPWRATIAANLVYVNYTSGSTGNPKGAMITHRAIVNVMWWMQSAFPLDKQDRVLQQISFSFDPSVLEILAPLFVGGRLVLARPGGHQDPTYLVQTILAHEITVLHVVPSTLRMLLQIPELQDCQSLRHVFCGGEVLSEQLARAFFEVLKAELHCMYGPTEVAITSVFNSVRRDHLDEIIPIGRPVDNVKAYVLDCNRQPVPIGVSGELYLGGVQVGLGYHNRPELTGERFIADPFNNAPGALLYRTGDQVRYLPDRKIQFLGRIDHQVKLRGQRVELGEIESVTRLHPMVRESVVVMREDAPGDKRLVAYVRTAVAPSVTLLRELRSLLNERLPTHMVPSALVFLDAFPMTPNGKLDRTVLPPPRSSDFEDLQSRVPPRTPTEEVLIGVWREFLGPQPVGVQDNFFELGGHSLLMVRMFNRINQVLSVDLAIADLLQNPTVEKLAGVIADRKRTSKRRAAVVQLQQGKAELPLYFIYAGPDEFRLATSMGDGQPIFGIQQPWPLAWREAVARNEVSAFPSMEQLVAPYVTELRSHCRSSSCVLAGYSFAGLMAFEVAHEFQRQGGNVEMVILIDTPARRPTARQVARQQWRENWTRTLHGPASERFSHSIGSRLWRSWLVAQWMLGQEITKMVRAIVPKPDQLSVIIDEQGVPVPWRYLNRLYAKVANSYKPLRLESRGGLFLSMSKHDRLFRACDDSLGWKGLFAGDLEVIPVSGDHRSMITENNQVLAQEINEVLKGLSSGLDKSDCD
jgi:amino acid adenylation domain-containing protein